MLILSRLILARHKRIELNKCFNKFDENVAKLLKYWRLVRLLFTILSPYTLFEFFLHFRWILKNKYYTALSVISVEKEKKLH